MDEKPNMNTMAARDEKPKINTKHVLDHCIKSEFENSSLPSSLKHESKDLVGCSGVTDYESLPLSPSVEIKVEPETFVSDGICTAGSTAIEGDSLTHNNDVTREGNLIVFTGLLNEDRKNTESYENQRMHKEEETFSDDPQNICLQKGVFGNDAIIQNREEEFTSGECEIPFGRQTQSSTHAADKPFECKECDKAFSCERYLVNHMAIHSGVKPYKCTECGKAFFRESSLFSHKRLHMEVKPFRCVECGKSFSQKVVLENHVRVHTGEKPFCCDVCGRAFS
ncbi:zinc finger protein 813-like [Macrobrachium nipponense]|uniref:zinc finger protein 813-like n=1 Tax=Macrobrachium nipponense TaxID=159736 RepID=UPI0030C7D718